MTVIHPVEWHDGCVRFLDQTLLPEHEMYTDAGHEQIVADAIRRLAIRGAPLIGIAAAYGVALAAVDESRKHPATVAARVEEAIRLLAATRPTAANLFWALNRQREVLRRNSGSDPGQLVRALVDEAAAIHREDRTMCDRMAGAGADLLEPGSTVLTHCNTGALATGGRGTALGVIARARELGRVAQVYVDETRPLLQGARLTAWELQKLGIPFRLITDSTAAVLMKQHRVTAVLVGADRIAANGDTANKIGTYALAVLARHHGIPVYVVAPMSSVDAALVSGDLIPIEERPSEEITSFCGLRIAPAGTPAFAPAFDVTPHALISAIVTDRGIAYPPFEATLAAYSTPENG